jgi:hypothetical protein
VRGTVNSVVVGRHEMFSSLAHSWRMDLVR